MKLTAKGLFALILKFGGPGLLVLGILDSSFLFAPLGNDVLVILLCARHPTFGTVLYYSAMSAIGSVLGALLVDLVMRPLGAAGLERFLSGRQLKRVQSKTKENAARAVAIASIAPPPFPFTAVIMSTSALQYSRGRMLTVVGLARMVRFTALGLLALKYGRHMLRWVQNPVVQELMLVLTVVFTIGSAISVYGWIRKARAGRRAPTSSIHPAT
jgi:membrane protein YqaA with SNARE-associated domain